MKIKRINNTSEIKTYNELTKAFCQTHYQIFPKLQIKDVIDSSVYKKLNKKEMNFFNESHFDFVVTDGNHTPVFAVEFDGPHHFIYNDKIKRDIRKNKICYLAELPLLRVTDFEIEAIDNISILQYITYRFIKWEIEHTNIKEEINNELIEMSEHEIQNLTKNGFLDPSIDVEFRFDLQYPFPLRNQLISELKEKYSISVSPDKSIINPTWYHIVPVEEKSIKNDYLKTFSYGIYKGHPKNNALSWKNGMIQNKDIQKLIEEKITFGMRWGLIIDEEYDIEEAPINFILRKGRYPIYFSDIPGGSVPSIIESVLEYECLSKIREWALNNQK